MREQDKIAVEAEEMLLGSMILEPDKAVALMPKIHEELFTSTDRINIFRGIKECLSQCGKVNLVILRNKLAEQNALEGSGGAVNLARITQDTKSPQDIENYLEICSHRHEDRMAAKICQTMQSKLAKNIPGREIIAQTEQDIVRAINSCKDSGVVCISDIVDSIEFSLGRYIPTGFPSIDDAIYGAGAGDMIVVAGRPQSGKSCLLLNIASNMSGAGIPIALFSLEMTTSQYTQRLLCSKAKINFREAIHGRLTGEHKASLEMARRWIKESKLYIDDHSFLSPQYLRFKLMQLKNRYGIQVCFIDYLQLMQTDNFNSLYEKATEISKTIKSMALELQMPIITAAQLNRECDKREDGRPRISDLRDSGSVEQDADIILLIHRPGLSTNTDTSECEIIVGKNRRGERPVCKMHFVPQYTTFVEQ